MEFKINCVLSIILIVLLVSCESKRSETLVLVYDLILTENQEAESKISVLNFGTFHMGFTNDASSTEFDEHDRKNQQEVHQIAQLLTAFKPTVIVVEWPPSYNAELKAAYDAYVANPKMFIKNPTEVELLAFEIGRLSNTPKIYGIDHKMGYNYGIGTQIDNKIDPKWHDKYYEDPLKYYPEVNVNEDSLSLIEKLKLSNHDQYLDFLITVNADMLTHAGTENKFEGADEAAKYYQRNLRMFSNLNRLNLSSDDRVFILMGASHTAFFRDFMSRSPKYEMVNTFDYLK